MHLSTRPEPSSVSDILISIMKKLYVFDLDGTLAPSRFPIEEETASLVCQLLAKTKVAVMSGASMGQLHDRLIMHLPCGDHERQNLYLLPTSGAALYHYANVDPEKIYEETLSSEEKESAIQAIKESLIAAKFEQPLQIYGEQIEDRGTQITFSALGQEAPLFEKEKWDPDRRKRIPIQEELRERLPNFEVHIGGTTTIDITKAGIDKAYGLQKILDQLGYTVWDAEYIGDALFEGGNDAAVLKTGIKTVAVRSPAETRDLIRRILTGEVA